MGRTISRCVAVIAMTAALCSTGCGGLKGGAAAADHLASGNALFKQGEYQQAIIELQSALKIDPRLGQARHTLADAYLKVNDTRNALREYVRAADLLPDDAEVQITAGKLLALSGRFEDAKARAQAVLTKNPRNVDAQLLLGNSLVGMKDLDGAVAQVQEAAQLDPTEGRVQANLGMLQLARGDKDRAAAAFEQAVTLDPASPAAHLALGTFRWSTGDLTSAEREYKKALELDPRHAQATRTLAAFYAATGRALDAEPYLKRLAETGPAAARMELADYYVRLRRYDEAAAIFEHFTGDEQLAASATTRLAGIAFARGRLADAHRLVDQVLTKNARNSEALLTKGRLLLAENRRDEAEQRLAAAVEADPRSTTAQYLLGTIYANRGDITRASTAFAEVLKLNPGAMAARLQMVRMTLAAGRADTSAQLAAEAVRMQPDNPVARLLLIDALLAQSKTDEATRALKEMAAQYPRVAAVHIRLGRLAAITHDMATSRSEFARALAIEPRSLDALSGIIAADVAARRPADAKARVEAYLVRVPDSVPLLMLAARTYLANGDMAKAEGVLQRAIAKEPANLKAYDILGQIYLAQGKLDDARRKFEDLGGRQASPTVADTIAAMILQAQNKRDEARVRYERILERDPDAAAAANNLAWMYSEPGGDLDRALQLAKVARRQAPDEPQVSDTLGWIYYRRHMPTLAVPELERSVQKDPQNPSFHYHLGLVYSDLGETTKARIALQQALKLGPAFSGADQARALLAQLN
jgi:putative PEP-CTERM system TPR-repeat lipoprotein